MSWTILTLIFVFACFLGAFALGEWLAGRTRESSGNDGDRTAG